MPIFTMIATALLAGTFLAGTIATGILAAGLGLAASLGLNYAIKALSGQPTTSASAAASHFSAQGTLQAGGDVARSFNVGYSSTAGSLVYANTWGNSGGTPNAYFTQVIALADLPGGTLTEVWVNGQLCTLGGTAVAAGYPVTQYNKGGVDYLWVKYYDGTQTSADTFLTGTVSSTNYPWGSTRVGTGVAYVICTALVNDTLYTGFPTFKFAVSGIPLYDPSKDSTVGGSGSHVYGTPSTWGGDGDSLPAVQAYNILRGISYGGKWFYGPQNMSGPRLPPSNWIAQINKCRATITGVSGLEATYRSGGQISVGAQPANALETILTTCQGRLSEIGGFYKIHLGTPDSTTFTFTDDVILSTEDQNFTPFFSLADSVNGISGSYPSPAQAWATTVAPPYYRTDLEVLDGNRRLMANTAFDFVPYDAQVQRLMKSAVQEAQRARRHTVVLPSDYWIVEPGDVGEWTSTRNGYTSKKFRVDGIIDKANLDVITNITEVDPSDYNWTHGTDFTTPTVGPTIVVWPTPQAIAGWTVTAYIINDSGGSPRRPGILLGWTATEAGINGVQFEVRLQATGDVVLRGRTDNYAIASCVISSDAILPNTVYEVRGQYIPSSPRDMSWSSWIAVTTSSTFLTLIDFDASVVSMLDAVEQVDSQALIDAQNLIASIAANQDARGWLDKKEIRGQLDAVAGGANAAIATLQTVQANDEAAFASYQATVTAQFGTTNASVTTNSTAVATLNGYAAAQYSVTLDVNGYGIGFNLLNGGGTVSSATFTVAKFQIASPGVTGGAPVPIFTVANVGGTPKVGIRGDMIVDGSITTQTINAGAITATQIAANTITANKIAAGTITATEIAAGSIDTAHLAVNSVDIGNIIDGATSNTGAIATTAVINLVAYTQLATQVVNIQQGRAILLACVPNTANGPVGLKFKVDGTFHTTYSWVATDAVTVGDGQGSAPASLVISEVLTSMTAGNHTFELWGIGKSLAAGTFLVLNPRR